VADAEERALKPSRASVLRPSSLSSSARIALTSS
jgi:hypothetical protein